MTLTLTGYLLSLKGKKRNHCIEFNLTQLISSPTQPDTRNPGKSTLIDIIPTNKPHKFTASGVFELDLSDQFSALEIPDKKNPSHNIKRERLNIFAEQVFLRDLVLSDYELLLTLN